MIKFSHLLICSFLFLGTVVTYGQKYGFSNVGKEKQIPAKYIYDLEQGADKKLYLATENGLLSYNGRGFEVVHQIVENICSDLLVTSNAVYFGYFDGRVFKYSYQGEIMEISDPNMSQPPKLLSFSDELLTFYKGQGLFHLEENQLVPFPMGNKEPSEIIDVCTGRGDLMLSYSDQLVRLSLTDETSIKLANGDFKSLHRINDSLVFAERFDDDGLLFCMGKDEVESINISLGDETEVESIQFDGNNLWIATKNTGLFKVAFTNNQFGSYSTSNYTEENGLLSNQLKSIVLDEKKSLWIGFYGAGLMNLPNERVLVYREVDGQDLTGANCLESLNGALWIGRYNGLYQLNFDDTKEVKRIVFEGEDDINVSAIHRSFENDLWVGTVENGLFVSRDKGETFQPVIDSFGNRVKYIKRIRSNNKGVIYVATDIGLYYWSPSSNDLKYLSTNQGLVHNVLNDVYPTKDGSVWFATSGSPLFSLSEGEFIVHRDVDSLTSFNMCSFTEIHNGNLLVSSEMDGLVVLSEGDEVHRLTNEIGLPYNLVYYSSQVSKNEIWLFHREAITVIDTLWNIKTVLNSTKDLFDSEISRYGILDTEPNYFWLTSTEGIVRVAKEYIEIDAAPNIEMIGFELNAKKVKTIEHSYNYGNYDVKFFFQAIAINNPEEITYEYFLEGYEKKWNETSTGQNVASYPQLTDGQYVFKVRARDQNGNYSKTISVPFVIERPFWKSIWFIILMPLLLLGLIFGYFQNRIARERRQKIILEKQVRDRTIDLRMERDNLKIARDQIQHKNKEITDSINYAERIQKAILPDLNDTKILKEESCFIWFRPCDIVSGDFYWVNFVNGKQIIVVADCTGHGVPGAFMSMISSTLIDKIVFDYGITDPKEMVAKLDKNLDKALKSSISSAADGIDIGVLVIDRSSNRADYCGASRPLYVMRAGEDLEVLKGSYLSIGEHYEGFDKDFISHEIKLEEGMQFYLSSDGFADQFGGARDRKYMVGKFKKFISQLSLEPIHKQKSILISEHDRWRGEKPQTDDILVVGVRI